MYKSYKQYKNSNIDWIGVIPNNWEVVQPKYKLNKVTRLPEEDDKVITCFRDGVVTLRKNRREDGFTNSLKEHGYQQIHKGDLVVHEMDGFAGAIGISDSKGKSTPVYTVIEPDERAELRYISYLLKEMSQTGKIESLARSIRERTTDFRWNIWSVTHLPFPPIEEQKRISKFLDKKTKQIDLLTKKIEQKIELLKEQNTSLICNAVSKGINKNNETVKTAIDWIPEVPKHWTIKKLKYIFTEKKAINNLKLNSGSISFGEVVFKDDEKILESTKQNYQEVLKGEFLINPLNLNYDLKSLRIGKSKIDVVVSQGYIVLILNEGYNPKFFEFLLRKFDVEKMKSLGHGVRQTISFMHIKDIELPVPPLIEQEHISKFLISRTSKYKQIIELESQRLAKIKEYRKALISNIVTGKIEITDEMI